MTMEIKDNQKILRCKSSTDANKLAGSIYSIYLDVPPSGTDGSSRRVSDAKTGPKAAADQLFLA